MAVELRVDYRNELGKSAVRKLRAAGYLPGVIYGASEETQHIKFNASEFEHLWHQIHGESVVINLIFPDGTKKMGVIQEVARHPVTGKMLHVDFHILHKGEKVEVTVPIVTVGTPKGVKMGGILEHIIREVDIKTTPDNIPPHIEIDVSGLGIGDSIHIKDLQLEGIEIDEDPEEVIVTVLAPRKVVEEVVEEEAAEEGEAAAEGEATEEG